MLSCCVMCSFLCLWALFYPLQFWVAPIIWALWGSVSGALAGPAGHRASGSGGRIRGVAVLSCWCLHPFQEFPPPPPSALLSFTVSPHFAKAIGDPLLRCKCTRTSHTAGSLRFPSVHMSSLWCSCPLPTFRSGSASSPAPFRTHLLMQLGSLPDP